VAVESSLLRTALLFQADLQMTLECPMLRKGPVVSARPKYRRIQGGLQLESREERCAIEGPILRPQSPKEIQAQLAAAERVWRLQFAANQAAQPTEFAAERGAYHWFGVQ